MKGKVYTRDIDGLRDALMDELQDIRDGIATPAEANAFAAIADRVIAAKRIEVEHENRQYNRQRREFEFEKKVKLARELGGQPQAMLEGPDDTD